MSTKIAAAAGALMLVFLLFIASIVGTLGALTSSPNAPSTPSQAALADIPADYLPLYIDAAATCPGLDWSVLAAVGKVETDHGRSILPGVAEGTQNSAGARGPMQFLQPTFDEVVTRHTIPPGGHNPPSPWNKHDAIFAASFYLCDNLPASTSRTCAPPEPPPDQAEPSAPVGKAHYLCDNGAAQGDLEAAIFAYNRAGWYVDQVLAQAETYRSSASGAQDGQWPDEDATVADPTGTGGLLTPRMHTLYQALAAAGATRGGATCWDAHLHNPTSDHPRGMACDIFYNPDDSADVANGWNVANWLTTVQAVYGIRYVIWQGQIWSARSPTWTTYTSEVYNCPDSANLTGCHYDHIHVSVY